MPILLLCSQIFCYPQTIRLPDIQNKAQPSEVNSLQLHNHHPRSIAHTPDVYSQNDVEDTIKEVEAMLKANPTLPRLTRGEILDLLENITKTDMKKDNTPEKSEDPKERDSKAIMVVMPFTPTNDNDKNMEELYTKSPVTHIVGTEPFKATQTSYGFKKIPSEISNLPSLGKNQVSASDKIRTRGAVRQKTSTPSPELTTHSSETSNPPQVTTRRGGNRRRRPPTPTPSPTTYHPSRRPIRRRPTTTERYPNHRYPDETSTEQPEVVTRLPSNGIRIIEPPKFSISEINEDLQMQENRQPGIAMGQSKMDSVSSSEDQVENGAKFRKQANAGSLLVDLVPQHLKGVLKDINSQTEETVELKPTTSTTNTTTTTTTTTIKTSSIQEEEEKIRKILASFGALPVKTTTTTAPVPDISNVADSLTPEMRDLLMSFGLLPDSDQNKPVKVDATTKDVYGFNPVKAEVKPDAYAGFKPLPTDDSSRHDMDELLAQFGLDRSARKEKSIRKKNENKAGDKDGLNFEAVPAEYMEVLDDIGLTDRQGKMIRSEALVKTQEKQHVFNPEPQNPSEEDLEKLNKLLTVIRQLESLNNGNVTDEELKQIDLVSLNQIISSLNEENQLVPLHEQNAPNPLHFDFGLEKNEVKRQENTSTTTSSPTTTTQESQNANIKDLEASFGGQVDASPTTEAAAAETTTPLRKTGFYYLVDWNTFLDIDDQKGKRVNLRFQPKVGDPKRFYSVSVP